MDLKKGAPKLLTTVKKWGGGGTEQPNRILYLPSRNLGEIQTTKQAIKIQYVTCCNRDKQKVLWKYTRISNQY